MSALLIAAVGGAYPASAEDFTAGVVMRKMKDGERYPYVAGVVEGVAYARYERDGKQTAGMKCVYDWFYEDRATIDLIYVAFSKFPDHTPGAIIAAMARKKCGG